MAIAQHHEAGFFTLQKLFDHHPRAARVMGHTQGVVQEHEIDRLVGFGQRHGHDHAFARRQAVGLDHDGRAFSVHIGVGQGRVGEGFELGGGDAMALHERFGKGLRALQLGRRLRGPKNAQAVGSEIVHDACGQRGLGAHQGQTNAVIDGPLAQRCQIGDRHIDQVLVFGCAAVARCHVNLLDFGRLRQFPRHGVLTATTADYQYFHQTSLIINFGVVENVLHIVQIFQHIQQFLHFDRIIAR